MKITIEPTDPRLKCFDCVLETKVSVEVKDDNLTIKEVMKHVVRSLQACGYREDGISECLSDEFAFSLGFLKTKNDTTISELFYGTADAISKDFTKSEAEVSDSVFSYKINKKE